MRKIIWGLSLMFLMTGCSLFDAPEGTVEVEMGSVHTRVEQPTTTEEIVYCSADLKITNTGNKTIYNCTVSAVAKSDMDIEHYISFTRDVNIPPSQSIYLTAEWTLVRKLGVTTETVTGTSTETYSGSETAATHGTDTESTSGHSTTHENGSTDTKGTSTVTDTTTKSESSTKTDITTTTGSDTTVESTINSSTQTTSNGGTTVTSTSVTTITTELADSNEETEWKKDSIKIISYFFN